MINKLKKNYLVVLLGFLVTILVSLVLIMGNMTNELPELQQDEQSMKMLQEVFNEIGYYNYDDVTEIYTVYSDAREKIGYAFVATGYGYGGNITILVGLEDKKTIKGISIIEDYELLHLGEGAVAELDFSGFVKQFMGVSINACLLDKDGGEIDGITGATKSSKAVVDAVREICFYKIQLIK